MFSGEPCNSVASDVMMFECGFELCNEVGEGSHSYGSPRDGILSKGGCPGKSRSFSHVGQSEGNFLVVIVIDFFIDEEVEPYSIQPLGGFVVRSIKGFQCSYAEFGGFRGGHW